MPLRDATTNEVFTAAEGLDRLQAKGVDPKVVEFSREMSVLYRRFGNFRRDAYEKGRKGEGFVSDRAEIEALSAESNRMGEKLLEIDKYVRDTYKY